MASKTMLGTIVTAAGAASRYGGEKILAPVRGTPLLYLTLARLGRVPGVEKIVLVLPPERLEAIREGHGERLAELGVEQCVAGGATRQESVRRGLDALPLKADPVLVHDAVRPLFSPEAVELLVATARREGAAILAVPVRDTLKRVSDELSVEETVSRDGIWRAETPQVVRRELLLAAYRRADEDGFLATDEASLVEHLGLPVAVIRGAPLNVKVTEPEDLRIVEALLLEEE